MSCRCSEPPFYYKDYESKDIGVDPNDPKFGEVSMDLCRSCDKLWLKYHIEWDGYSRSGRWYRGEVTPEQAEGITPQKAAELLKMAEWHFKGGSYYKSGGIRVQGGASLF
ncbi:MAG: hypothetical protein HKN50_10840 [Gammaproteobacteria bacterium]|nr:hypothetical protein [Gammaproteobacteria bacterium]